MITIKEILFDHHQRYTVGASSKIPEVSVVGLNNLYTCCKNTIDATQFALSSGAGPPSASM
jgi:hypothetical protein